MDNDQISQKIKKIKEIYNFAMTKIKELELRQKKSINDFIEKLEQRKMEEIRKNILSK